MDKIQFFIQDISYNIKHKKHLRQWIHQVAVSYNKEIGNISFILCTDDYLLSLNQSYLHHDTYTDIITFDYTDGDKISGDIYISLERIQENAVSYAVSLDDELYRVMIHGILHLIGYNDDSVSAKKIMRDEENKNLQLLTVPRGTV